MTCHAARDLMLVCLTGSATPDERRALQAHLHSCPDCRAQAGAVEETVTLLRAVPEPHLIEAHWAAFSHALQQRLEEETNTLWSRVTRWARIPRVAWRTAVASSVLVVVLGVTLLLRTTPPQTASVPGLPATLSGLVTESIARAMPSMASTLDLWSAQLVSPDVSSDQEPAGGD